MDEIGGINDAITYAAKISELEDYKVLYYSEAPSTEVLILEELIENFDLSFRNTEVLSALNGLGSLYKTLIGIQEPKALLTCNECLVNLD